MPARNLAAAAAAEGRVNGGGGLERALQHDKGGLSLHGQNAARRQAITELLFFSSVGDLYRCQKICSTWKIDVSRAAVLMCVCVGGVPLFVKLCVCVWEGKGCNCLI